LKTNKKLRLNFNRSRRNPWVLKEWVRGELSPEVQFFDTQNRDLEMFDSPGTQRPYILIAEMKYKISKTHGVTEIKVAFLNDAYIKRAKLKMLDSKGNEILTFERPIDIQGAGGDTLLLTWRFDFEREI